MQVDEVEVGYQSALKSKYSADTSCRLYPRHKRGEQKPQATAKQCPARDMSYFFEYIGELYMCGIVGYAGSKNAVPVLLNGLYKLEYRGYDSAGVGFI